MEEDSGLCNIMTAGRFHQNISLKTSWLVGKAQVKIMKLMTAKFLFVSSSLVLLVTSVVCLIRRVKISAVEILIMIPLVYESCVSVPIQPSCFYTNTEPLFVGFYKQNEMHHFLCTTGFFTSKWKIMGYDFQQISVVNDFLPNFSEPNTSRSFHWGPFSVLSCEWRYTVYQM